MPDMNSHFLGVELRIWITGGAIVLLVALAHVGLGWWKRRRSRIWKDGPLAPGESATVRYWIARSLSDAVPPIAFMLWLHGLYFAVTMLLAEFPQTSWLERTNLGGHPGHRVRAGGFRRTGGGSATGTHADPGGFVQLGPKRECVAGH